MRKTPGLATRVLTIPALLLALLSLLAASCGGDDDDAEAPAQDNRAAIVVEAPKPGASVSSPVMVSGTASVFEGTVQIRILDAEGEELARTFTTASAGAPERGEFSERVEFEVGEAQDGVIELFEENVASAGEGGDGGSELNEVEVPVTLEP
jgi:Immunoglobulin-like domain of bacterial spore germination